MKNSLFWIPSLAGMLFFSGCATPYRLALPSNDPIPDTVVRLSNEQQELDTEIVSSNIAMATGGGLLFALADTMVNHARAGSASDAATVVRDVLVDYDFGEVFQGVVARKLPKTPLSALGQVEFFTMTAAGTAKELVASSEGQAVCLIEPYYTLTAGFEGLRVRVDIAVYPKSTELKARLSESRASAKDAVLYRNRFTSVVKFPSYTKDLTEQAEAVAADPEYLRGALTESMEEIVAMWVYDLGLLDLGSENMGEKVALKLSKVAQQGTEVLHPYAENRRWIRTADHQLYAQDL